MVKFTKGWCFLLFLKFTHGDFTGYANVQFLNKIITFENVHVPKLHSE